MNATKINLGAAGAEAKIEGYINVDWQPITNPDVVHDLNTYPYPFEDNSADEIIGYHVLEHLDRPFSVMKEIHRILKPGGKLHIKVPHFSRGFTHAEHAHGFDVTFPLYFNPRFVDYGYFGVEYRLESMRLTWFAFPHLLPHLGYGRITIALLMGISRSISFIANLSPAFASRIWCFWVGGFDQIEYRFICVK